MKTFNFILWDKDGVPTQVEVNAETEDKAWTIILGDPILRDMMYIDLMP